MPSLYEYDKFQRYLFELESELSLIGISECQDLQADTQLSAAIYALLRATKAASIVALAQVSETIVTARKN